MNSIWDSLCVQMNFWCLYTRSLVKLTSFLESNQLIVSPIFDDPTLKKNKNKSNPNAFIA